MQKNREVNSLIAFHGMTPEEACEMVCLPESELKDHITKDAGYLPSPEDIELACREFRKGWSAKERRNRDVCTDHDRRVETTVIDSSDFGELITAESHGG